MKRLDVTDNTEDVDGAAIQVNEAVEQESVQADATVVAQKEIKPTKKALKIVKKGFVPVKRAIKKVDPLNQKINKNSTTDTGIEGIRLGVQGVKTTEKTVKTTKKTVKTVKNTGEAAAKTVKTAAKATVVVTKYTCKAVAALADPYVLGALAIIVLIILLINSFMLLISGETTNETAVAEPVALSDMVKQYEDAEKYYNTALSDRKQFFYDAIDKLTFYNEKDRIKDSDLISVAIHTSGNCIDIVKDYASDARKSNIKNNWNYQISDSDKNLYIAIAYCYMEKKINDENQTSFNIYEADFTQELFDELLEKTVSFSETVTEHQECPNRNCIRDQKKYAEWQDVNRTFGDACAAFNEWTDIADDLANGRDVPDWRIDNWKTVYHEVYEFTQPVIEPYFDNNGYDYLDYLGERYEWLGSENDRLYAIYDQSTDCAEEHNLYHYEVTFNSTDELMNILDFDDNYKAWVELIKTGFDEIEGEK